MASLLCAPCKNPFCPYVTVAVGINIGNIVVGAKAVPTLSSCRGSTWLVVNLAFAVAHIAASVYVAHSVSNRHNHRLAESGRTTAIGRAGHLLCHDPWIAAYLLILVVSFAWVWVGVSWRVSGEDDSSGCPPDVEAWVGTGIGCTIAFFICCSWALCASACCALCCDKKDYTPNPPSEQPGYVQPQPQQPAEEPSAPEEGGGDDDFDEEEALHPLNPTPSQMPIPIPVPADSDVEAGKGNKGGGASAPPTALTDSVVPIAPPPATVPVVATPAAAKGDPNYDSEVPVAVAVPCKSENTTKSDATSSSSPKK